MKNRKKSARKQYYISKGVMTCSVCLHFSNSSPYCSLTRLFHTSSLRGASLPLPCSLRLGVFEHKTMTLAYQLQQPEFLLFSLTVKMARLFGGLCALYLVIRIVLVSSLLRQDRDMSRGKECAIRRGLDLDHLDVILFLETRSNKDKKHQKRRKGKILYQ